MQASYTVEAALVFPVILLAVIGCLYLDFHVHSRACLTAASCEQAITGHDPANPDLFGVFHLTREKTEGENKRRVAFSAETIAAFGSWKWEMEEAGTYEIQKPVKRIREIKAAEETAAGWEEG